MYLPCSSNCLNNNIGYQTLDEAWQACKLIEPCVYITRKDDIYYMRRKEEREKWEMGESWGTIEYECTGIHN